MLEIVKFAMLIYRIIIVVQFIAKLALLLEEKKK